jgi:hypothetical protein
MSEFTPGPWEVREVDGLFAIACRDGWVLESNDEQQDRADAKLIAAAPELYAALEMVLNQSWDGPIGAEHHARKQAAAALAKARGE